ncbi:DUF438 domain-containing protein [Deferribacteraceae bacterium V6Fe1]|nr:DUF438 domain-containing protein [Deferribacteraceae bacterium V6Fe1]
MSELLRNEKSKSIFELTKSLIKGEINKNLIDECKNVSPADIINGFHRTIEAGFDLNDVKKAVNKVLNLTYKGLMANKQEILYNNNSIFHYLEIKNNHTKEFMSNLKNIVKNIKKDEDLKTVKDSLLEKLHELQEIDKHYKIKENIIFPTFEKSYPEYKCVLIMWSEHDDVRETIKLLTNKLKTDNITVEEFHKLIGKLFFDIYSLIHRESDILYPVLLELINEKKQSEMLKEGIDLGLIDSHDLEISDDINLSINNGVIKLETGTLSLQQLSAIFNNLPVDITFIDDKDEVKYFSNPKDRVFIRTKSAIGRKVQNCHPQKSLHTVENILTAFKNGAKNEADFWINIQGKMIYIKYFAIRDNNGKYIGTLEVTQDITEIKKIEGEKRLLDWS